MTAAPSNRPSPPLTPTLEQCGRGANGTNQASVYSHSRYITRKCERSFSEVCPLRIGELRNARHAQAQLAAGSALTVPRIYIKRVWRKKKQKKTCACMERLTHYGPLGVCCRRRRQSVSICKKEQINTPVKKSIYSAPNLNNTVS